VSLFVVNSFGCQQSIIKTAIVTPADSVHADFTYSYTNICNPPTLVDFTNTTTSASPLTYSWDFGNGNQSIAKIQLKLTIVQVRTMFALLPIMVKDVLTQ
jgi:PKD repeat protein